MPEVIRLDSVDSTSSEALRRAREHRLADGWIVAGAQSLGRGRHGRTWSSPPGGLYATRLIVTALPVGRLVGLTLVAGLAVHDAASHLVPESACALLTLKWPNDLLAGEAKLAGVLIETEPLGPDGNAVAIGIGMNVAASAAGEPAASSLSDLGGTADAEAAFDALSAALARRIGEWNSGLGLAAILSSWQERAMSPGTPTRVRIGNAVLAGGYRGLDATGAMLLELESGEVRAIHAGEVVLGTAPESTKETA